VFLSDHLFHIRILPQTLIFVNMALEKLIFNLIILKGGRLAELHDWLGLDDKFFLSQPRRLAVLRFVHVLGSLRQEENAVVRR
jgi:hypothetical protein